MRRLAGVLMLVTMTIGATEAMACSIDGCREGELSVVMRQVQVPGFSLPQDSEATVPANVPAILWRLNEDAYQGNIFIPDPHDVMISTEGLSPQPGFTFYEGTVPEEVDFLNRRTFILVPETALVADRQYLIGDMGSRESGCMLPEYGTFRTSVAASYPTSLGTLELPDKIRQYTFNSTVDYTSFDGPNPVWLDIEIEDDSMCTIYIGAAMAFVKFTPSEDAKPWKHALYYRLFVDDEPWIYRPGTPMDVMDLLGMNHTWSTVFAYCDAPADRCHKWYPLATDSAEQWREAFEPGWNQGIWKAPAPGVHKVRLQAWLPGTDIVLETPGIEIDIQCPERIEGSCPVEATDVIEDTRSPDDATDGDDSSGSSGCSASSASGASGASGTTPAAILLLLAAMTGLFAGRSMVRKSRQAHR